MTPLTFAAALVALLLSPGPTNTLLAIGGASLGSRRALPLIGVALIGYLTVVTPLALVGGPLLKAHPEIALGVALASAAWVLGLAINLWGRREGGLPWQVVSPRAVLVTTMLNPKTLVIGLVLLPATDFESLLPWLALFAGILLACSAVWVCAGAALGRATSPGLPPILRRGAALYLAVVAVGLVLGGIRTLT